LEKNKSNELVLLPGSGNGKRSEGGISGGIGREKIQGQMKNPEKKSCHL